MAYISCNKLWESEFDNIVSKKDKLQGLNINQSKLEAHDTYEKDEKITTNFEPTDGSDVVSKSYLDEKKKTDISLIRKTITTILIYNTTNNLQKRFQFKEL